MRNTWKAILAVVLAFTMMVPAAMMAGAEEPYLKNPSLEELNEDGTTTYWDIWPGNPNEGEKHASVSTAEKHSGKQSLCIELTPKNNQAVYQYHLLADKRFPFGKAYTFSAWIKMENVTPSDADGVRIGVNRKGADGNGYDLRESIEVGTYGWTKVSITVPKALVGLVQYDLIIDIGRGTGKVYIDDFELVDATDAPTTPVVTTTTQGTPGTTVAGEQTTKPESTEASNATESTMEGQTTAASTTAAVTTSTDKETVEPKDNGSSALPWIIVGAVIIAGAAVAVAVILIRKKKASQDQ